MPVQQPPAPPQASPTAKATTPIAAMAIAAPAAHGAHARAAAEASSTGGLAKEATTARARLRCLAEQAAQSVGLTETARPCAAKVTFTST